MTGGRLRPPTIGGRVAGYKPRATSCAGCTAPAGRRRSAARTPSATSSCSQPSEPEAAAATRWYLEPVDYLTMRFCGEATASHASMQGAWLTDVRHLDRLSYDQQLLDAARAAERQARTAATDRVGHRHGQPPTSPPPSGSHRRPSRDHGPAGPAGRRARRRRDRPVRHAPRPLDDVVDQLPGPEEEDRHLPLHRDGPGLTTGAYLVVNNQDTGAKALEWFRGALGAGAASATTS